MSHQATLLPSPSVYPVLLPVLAPIPPLARSSRFIPRWLIPTVCQCHPARTNQAGGQARHSGSQSGREVWEDEAEEEECYDEYPSEVLSFKLVEHYEQHSELRLAAEECEYLISIIPASEVSNPQSVLRRAKFVRADLHERFGDFHKSMAEIQEILKYLPSDREARIRLADLYAMQGDTKRGLDLVDSVVREDPSLCAETELTSLGSPGGVVMHIGAALAASRYAASLGNYSEAQRYLNGIPDANQSSELLAHRFRTIFRMAILSCSGGPTKRSLYSTELLDKVVKLESSSQKYMVSSWNFTSSTAVAREASLFYDKRAMLHLGMNAVSSHAGLVLEFGVWHGSSLRWIVSRFLDEEVHGFDTFTGLPEAWDTGLTEPESIGSYSAQGAVPADMPGNVHFHVGLFNDTLPQFLKAHHGPVRFMHIDCDLYSSTKDIFNHIFPRIIPGTVIVFDEYVMYETWQDGEFKAFQEAVSENDWVFQYLAISLWSKQAVVRISETPYK